MRAKNEELRSRLWRIAMTGSTVVIILIATYFLFRMFHANPLEGSWRSEDLDLILNVKGNSSIEAIAPEILEGEDIKLKLSYTIDKDEKTISIRLDDKEISSLEKKSDGELTEEILTSVVGPILTTFDYSVDQDVMTLSEREFGEQYIFYKE